MGGRRLVHQKRHLCAAHDQGCGGRWARLGCQQRYRLFGDPRGLVYEAHALDVLVPERCEVAALTPNRARHALGIRPSLHIGAVHGGRQQPAPLSVSVCSMSEPSVLAKTFSSRKKSIDASAERSRAPPALRMAAAAASRTDTFSSIGTLNGSRVSGVR